MSDAIDSDSDPRFADAGAPGFRLCDAGTLEDGGRGLRFEVVAGSTRCAAFAIRYRGKVFAYLNRCAHVPMELDWIAGSFLDAEAGVLVCATHGAMYEPESGRCAGGPCNGRGGLRPLQVQEKDGAVYWQPDEFATALAQA